MAGEKLDGTTLISAIDAQIAALQNLRSAALAAMAVGAMSQIGGEGVVSANSDVGAVSDLPEGAFKNKSVPACIELYLSSVGMKKKTNKEIAEALNDGGVETNADNFENTVASALFKLKKSGKVLRFKDGWGLAANYPAHIRGAAGATANVAGKKAGSKKKGQRKAKKTEVTQDASATATKAPTLIHPLSPAPESAQARIVRLLQDKPNAEFSPEDVAGALPDIKRNVIALILGRLTDERRKVAERTTSGKYRILCPSTHQVAAAN